MNETLDHLSLSPEVHLDRYGTVKETLDRTLTATAPTLSATVDPSDVLCQDACQIGTPEVAYYYDDDHLSNRGAALLVPAIFDAVEQAIGSANPSK